VAEAAARDGQDVMAALNEASKLLTDTQWSYRQATPRTRRLPNHVFFAKLILIAEWVAKAELKARLKATNDVALAASRPVASAEGCSCDRVSQGQKNPDPVRGARVRRTHIWCARSASRGEHRGHGAG
jgi:hypothetical protein